MVGDRVSRFHLSGFEVGDSYRPLDSIGSVGRIRQRQLEELELVDEFLHHGVVALLLVEDPAALTVDGLEVGLDACGLVGFLAVVALDVKFAVALAALVAQEGAEDLIEERVLQLVVLHVPIDIGLA